MPIGITSAVHTLGNRWLKRVELAHVFYHATEDDWVVQSAFDNPEQIHVLSGATDLASAAVAADDYLSSTYETVRLSAEWLPDPNDSSRLQAYFVWTL